jgi:hypothetical protein
MGKSRSPLHQSVQVWGAKQFVAERIQAIRPVIVGVNMQNIRPSCRQLRRL